MSIADLSHSHRSGEGNALWKRAVSTSWGERGKMEFASGDFTAL